MTKRDPREYDVKALAFIGDAVYEMYIREHIMLGTNEQVNKLHRKAIKYVSAKAQANIVKMISEKLTDEEIDIIRRGRNREANTVPKNTDIVTYKIATGFEALIGFLYMSDSKERMTEIIKMSIDVIENEG